MNVPNALTLARVVLVAPMVLLLLDGEHAAAAACVFGLGAFSDVLDGYIARSRGLVTTFGKLMDPVADKLLIGGAFISLAAVGRLGAWVVIVILAREIAVTALRAIAGRRGIVISANALGKAKTALQTLTVVVLIVVADPVAAWIDALTLATVAITIASGLSYFVPLLRGREPAVAASAS